MNIKLILLIFIVCLFTPRVYGTTLDLLDGNKIFVKVSDAHCDNGKHNYILVTDILDRVFDIRFNYNVNACIITEHYLNDNLSKEEYQRILYEQ